MKNKTFKIRPISLALLLAGIGMAPASYAVDLMAVQGSWTPVGGTPITMWGFAADTGSCPTGLVNWDVGPQLTDTDLVAGAVGNDLTINLRNCLSEGVSIVIPGQPATFSPVKTVDMSGRTRITAFTHEAAADGGTAIYTWTGVKDGTYLYQSGSHPAKQVQMGLYGALTVGTYPATSGDVTLLYSEIDPALHSPPAAATPLGYHPRHYLVNGEELQTSALTAGDTVQPTVLRMLNAGLDFHVPALNGGYMSLVAEDGNPYPFAKEQYSVSLAAGKTIDALWLPASAGNHVIYDRRGNGMVASLTAIPGTPPANTAPMAVDDSYNAFVGVTLDVGIPGVLINDSDADFGDILTATLVTGPIAITDFVLNADGSFSYTTTTEGPDSFTYQASDGTDVSNIATVTITATVAPDNTPPVAADDGYTVNEDMTLTIAAPGVLGNDSDVDGDDLTAVLDTNVTNGTLTLNESFGNFEYVPDAHFNGSDRFTYHANDGTADSNIATVTITVNPVNDAPVAIDDNYAVDEGSTLNVAAPGVLGNDTDVDGDTLNATLLTGPNANVGFALNADGSFTYVTADDGAESDSFTYKACDADLLCAVATVNIAINIPPLNTPPVAVADTATVVRNSAATFINLTDNDTDAENNLKDDFGNVAAGQITITALPNNGGTVTVVTNGVNYTPKANFAREEDFTYTVTDLAGATSNEVTVTVTVTR